MVDMFAKPFLSDLRDFARQKNSFRTSLEAWVLKTAKSEIETSLGSINYQESLSMSENTVEIQ